MKRTILLAIVWIGVCFSGIAQTDFSESNRWTEYRINIQNNSIVGKSQYWTAGDTIINEQTYKKIVSNPWYIGHDGYIAAIREDNEKVYVMPGLGFGYELEEEFLLYDYTVQVGDIITSTAPYGVLSYPLTVMQIDDITLETGEKRKRFILDYGVIWIEGIGSTSGLFNDAMEHPTNYNVSYLVCFKQGDEILYRNGEWCQFNNCCDDITNDAVKFSSAAKTIMTQDNNRIIIDFSETFSGETILRLFDATGRIVHTNTTNQDSFELNISGYPQGVYLISIQNGSNIEYFKFVK